MRAGVVLALSAWQVFSVPLGLAGVQAESFFSFFEVCFVFFGAPSSGFHMAQSLDKVGHGGQGVDVSALFY